MKPETSKDVLSTIKHFERDMLESGIFVLDTSSKGDNGNRYCETCKFGMWPKLEWEAVNPLRVGGPQLEIWFAHTEVYGSYTEWRPEWKEEVGGVLFHMDESLNEGYCGNTLIVGAGLVSIINNWGFNHGRFMYRSDGQGMYRGHHVNNPVEGIVRPHGTVTRCFLIYPEVYRT